MQIDAIPLLPSGKINADALPLLLTDNITVLPTNEVQHAVYAIWKKYMNLFDFSLDQDFFALGGNSLQAMQIIADIEETFKMELSMHEFYSHLSVAKLSAFITKIHFT